MQVPHSPRHASIQQLLDLEKHKLAELLLQQEAERLIRSGRPDALDPDIRTCHEMIRIWTARLESISSESRAA